MYSEKINNFLRDFPFKTHLIPLVTIVTASFFFFLEALKVL